MWVSASACTEIKGLLTDQAQPLSEASLSRQQGFATPCVNSHCLLLAALLRKVDTRQESWPVLPEGLTLSGYRFLWILPAGQPRTWLLGDTSFLASHTCFFQSLAASGTSLFSGNGHSSKCACSSADTGWPHRHLHHAQHSLSGFCWSSTLTVSRLLTAAVDLRFQVGDRSSTTSLCVL